MLGKLAVAIGIAAATTVAAESQVSPSPGLTYADLADLGLAAPVVAHVRIASASRLKPAEAPGLAADRTRFYVEAQAVSLIRGAGGLPSSVRFLADLPNDARGKPAKLRKGTEWLIFAQPVPNRAGELRLTGQIAHQPAAAERLRAILAEAARPGSAPRISGIGKAFHVPGSLPGESETQIFLQTAENRPVSLSIVRRPGQAPRWSVALSEIVDEAAAAPARDTLLWYRLACTLPPALPTSSVAEASPAEAGAIQADYNLVLQQLGRCDRGRLA